MKVRSKLFVAKRSAVLHWTCYRARVYVYKTYSLSKNVYIRSFLSESITDFLASPFLSVAKCVSPKLVFFLIIIIYLTSLSIVKLTSSNVVPRFCRFLMGLHFYDCCIMNGIYVKYELWSSHCFALGMSFDLGVSNASDCLHQLYWGYFLYILLLDWIYFSPLNKRKIGFGFSIYYIILFGHFF